VSQTWDAAGYAAGAAFVPALGHGVVELLAPQAGERVLDLGCGDGALTAALVAAGCSVLGVDASPSMVAAARSQGIEAVLGDGLDLAYDAEFDAVFSNAALHWMSSDPAAVIAGVARSLRPGGRFVGELGGHGNVAAITTALGAVLTGWDLDAGALSPWYFPTVEEYGGLLAAGGFVVRSIDRFGRPTALPGSMEAWLEIFAVPFLAPLERADRRVALAAVVYLLRPWLCDRKGVWTADYVRLRFAARRSDQQLLEPSTTCGLG